MKFFLAFLFLPLISFSQSIEMKVMDQGVLIPQADHSMIISPENGQMVYDHLTTTFWFYNGVEWIEVGNDNDTDDTNELQEMTVSVEGDTVYLSGGNYIIVPGSSDANYIKDFEGNVYNQIDINGQIWLEESMRTRYYNDGTPIPLVELDSEWDDYFNTPFEGSCWFDNDSLANHEFGMLYNWGVIDSTLNGNRNVCPEGFDIPTHQDFLDLRQYARDLFGGNAGGIKLKLPPGDFWDFTPSFPFGGPGDNETGFAAKGSGIRDHNDGSFDEIKGRVMFFSRTEEVGNEDEVYVLRLIYDDWEADVFSQRKGYGSSIRCIKM